MRQISLRNINSRRTLVEEQTPVSVASTLPPLLCLEHFSAISVLQMGADVLPVHHAIIKEMLLMVRGVAGNVVKGEKVRETDPPLGGKKNLI